MSRLYSNVRVIALIVMLATVGCSVTAEQSESVTPSDQTERVITAQDVEQLGPGDHLILDVRARAYRIDASAARTDLAYVDVVNPSGHVDTLVHLVASVVDTGELTRVDLERGFSIHAAGDHVAVGGTLIGVSERQKKCFYCECSDLPLDCKCEPTPCRP